MKGPIARGTVRTSCVLGLRLAVQAGTILLVARLLGPDQFGAFAGVSALAVMLGTLSTFGTHLVLLGEVSKEPESCARVLAYAIPTTLLCGGMLLVTYLLVCMFVLHGAGISLHVLLAIGVSETLLQPLLGLPATKQLALGHVARSQLLITLPLVLRLAAAAVVLLLHFTNPLTIYAYGYLSASLIALAVASISPSMLWLQPASWRLARKAELREAASYAALGLTANSPAELDKTLAVQLLPLGAAGVYAAGARVVGATTLPVIAMMLATLPRLFREGQDQLKRTAHLLRWIFGAALGYSIVLTIVLWLTAPMFDWLFGIKYHGLGHMIRWLSIASPGMALRLAAGNALMALSRPWMRVGFEVAGLVILVIAAIVLITHFGTLGMPLALMCSEWGMAIIGVTLVFTSRMIASRSVISITKLQH